jgi:hypothetical protein
LLEAAAAGQRCRPRVYAELARLRLADMVAENGQISAAQAGVILETLAEAGRQAPPLEQAAALKAEVWVRSGATAGPREFATLHAALDRFPRSLPLLYFGALLEAQRSVPDALALLERGAQLTATAAGKVRFEELRRRLLQVQHEPGSGGSR